MFSRQVENTVGKGEIAHYGVFSKDLYCRLVKTRAGFVKGQESRYGFTDVGFRNLRFEFLCNF